MELQHLVTYFIAMHMLNEPLLSKYVLPSLHRQSLRLESMGCVMHVLASFVKQNCKKCEHVPHISRHIEMHKHVFPQISDITTVL